MLERVAAEGAGGERGGRGAGGDERPGAGRPREVMAVVGGVARRRRVVGDGEALVVEQREGAVGVERAGAVGDDVVDREDLVVGEEEVTAVDLERADADAAVRAEVADAGVEVGAADGRCVMGAAGEQDREREVFHLREYARRGRAAREVRVIDCYRRAVKRAFVVAVCACLVPVASSAKPAAFVTVGTCGENTWYAAEFNCPDFLKWPGLPAIDKSGKKLALPWWEIASPLTGLPNLTVVTVDATTGKEQSKAVVWSYAEAHDYAVKMGDFKSHPKELAEITDKVKKRVATEESALADYAPLAACTAEKDPPRKDGDFPVRCVGHDAWTCGNGVKVAYTRDHSAMALTVGKTTKTIDTKSWWQKPVKGDGDGSQPVEIIHCITDARAIPESHRVAILVEHVCNTSGDWCAPDVGPAWHVVSAD